MGLWKTKVTRPAAVKTSRTPKPGEDTIGRTYNLFISIL